MTAVAEVPRALAVRADRLHPSRSALRESGMTSQVFVYLLTVAAVFFLLWFSRCRRNARTLAPDLPWQSDNWAVAAWLIPVVNLWFPRQLLLQVQRASSAGEKDRGRDEILVNAWWVAWAGHGVILTAAQAGGATSMPLLVVSSALELAAAALMICVIQRITAQQSAALEATSPAGPLAHA